MGDRRTAFPIPETEEYFEATLTETGGRWHASYTTTSGVSGAMSFEERRDATRWLHQRAASLGCAAFVLTEKRPDRARQLRGRAKSPAASGRSSP